MATQFAPPLRALSTDEQMAYSVNSVDDVAIAEYVTTSYANVQMRGALGRGTVVVPQIRLRILRWLKGGSKQKQVLVGLPPALQLPTPLRLPTQRSKLLVFLNRNPHANEDVEPPRGFKYPGDWDYLFAATPYIAGSGAVQVNDDTDERALRQSVAIAIASVSIKTLSHMADAIVIGRASSDDGVGCTILSKPASCSGVQVLSTLKGNVPEQIAVYGIVSTWTADRARRSVLFLRKGSDNTYEILGLGSAAINEERGGKPMDEIVKEVSAWLNPSARRSVR